VLPVKNSVNAIRPLTSHSDAATHEDNVSVRLASLGAQISRKLEEVEHMVGDASRQGPLSELKSLVAQMQELLEGRVEAEVARRTQELGSLSAFLQTNSEREKAALARELHDELGGILTPAKMDLAWLQSRLGGDPDYAARMARLGALIDQGIDLKRRIIENLRPSLLDHLGLESALQWYVDEACRKAKIEPHLHISKTLERLAPDLEIALYRLVQEAVTNAVRHSQAQHLDLTIERTPKGVHMTVQDDGVGIGNLEAAKKLSHGLAGMSHRARSINGTFGVHSLSGQGTRVDIFVPLASPI
jgi:signal transduction histidine kinase